MSTEKFFKIFNTVNEAQHFIACNIFNMYEVNSEVFSDGKTIVKYRSSVGELF